MPEFSLCFPMSGRIDEEKYLLFELPKELVNVMHNGVEQISIRGRDDDDAVLCTKDKTYNIRTVAISNSICILTPPKDRERGDIVIRGNIKQILELQLSMPKFHRIRGLLRGCELDETDNRIEGRRFCTLQEARAEIQASDHEFEKILVENRILILDGILRPISLGYLDTILELLLNIIVSLSLSTQVAPVMDLVETLQCEYEISQEVSTQVMAWFGGIVCDSSSGRSWHMEVQKVVRQLGIGILSAHRSEPIEENLFFQKWRKVVGDAFEAHVALSKLQGNYIISQTASLAQNMLTYLPSSELPLAPADRFAELFLIRSKWKSDEITPFLDDIAIDGKEKDRLLMKFARSISDKEGVVWYSARGGTIV